MSFWKGSKDRAAIARMQDEALHEEAYLEIQSGQRRHGLWAKAILDSGGDETKAKIAYLRLLVSALRDERYLAQRMQEEVAAQTRSRTAQASSRTPPRDPLNGYDENGRTPLMNSVLAGDVQGVRELLEKGADVAIKDSAFGTSTALDMAVLAKRRAKSESEMVMRESIVHALLGAATLKP